MGSVLNNFVIIIIFISYPFNCVHSVQTIYRHTAQNYTSPLTCNDGEDCEIYCMGKESCGTNQNDATGIDIICPNNYNCLISCNNIYSCQRSVIRSGSNSNVTVYCNHKHSCTELIVHISPYGILNIINSNSDSNTEMSMNSIQIYGDDFPSNMFNMNCYGSGSGTDSTSNGYECNNIQIFGNKIQNININCYNNANCRKILIQTDQKYTESININCLQTSQCNSNTIIVNDDSLSSNKVAISYKCSKYFHASCNQSTLICLNNEFNNDTLCVFEYDNINNKWKCNINNYNKSCIQYINNNTKITNYIAIDTTQFINITNLLIFENDNDNDNDNSIREWFYWFMQFKTSQLAFGIYMSFGILVIIFVFIKSCHRKYKLYKIKAKKEEKISRINRVDSIERQNIKRKNSSVFKSDASVSTAATTIPVPPISLVSPIKEAISLRLHHKDSVSVSRSRSDINHKSTSNIIDISRKNQIKRKLKARSKTYNKPMPPLILKPVHVSFSNTQSGSHTYSSTAHTLTCTTTQTQTPIPNTFSMSNSLSNCISLSNRKLPPKPSLKKRFGKGSQSVSNIIRASDIYPYKKHTKNTTTTILHLNNNSSSDASALSSSDTDFISSDDTYIDLDYKEDALLKEEKEEEDDDEEEDIDFTMDIEPNLPSNYGAGNTNNTKHKSFFSETAIKTEKLRNKKTSSLKKSSSSSSVLGLFRGRKDIKRKLTRSRSISGILNLITFTPNSKKNNDNCVSQSQIETKNKLTSSMSSNASKLWSNNSNNLNYNCSTFLWEIFYSSQLYGGALLHTWDTATDIGVMLDWIETKQNFYLIIASISCLLLYRCVSAIVLWAQFGWRSGLWQFLDMAIYTEIYRSLENEYCSYTLELRWIRKMEAVFESAPQALLQLGWLLLYYQNIYISLDSIDGLVLISLITSLLSISFAISRGDETSFQSDAIYMLHNYGSIFFCCNNKNKKSNERSSINNHNHHIRLYSNNNNGLQVDNYIGKRSPLPDLPSSVLDKNNNLRKNSLKLICKCNCKYPNHKYFIRLLFRLCEATSRICTLGLLWSIFGGEYLLCGLLFQLMMYFILYQLGLIGREYGNMIALLVVHPNLTLRVKYNGVRHPQITKFITILNFWYIIHKIFGVDTVFTHYIHRLCETLLELGLVIVCTFYYRINSDQNPIMVMVILGIAIITSVLTPILLGYIKPWLKPIASLENDIFGIILSFDYNAIAKFLSRSKKKELLLNQISQNGLTPLALIAKHGQFYDDTSRVKRDLLSLLYNQGANINQANRLGETPIFTLAKSAKSFRTFILIRGLKKFFKLGADFCIHDYSGWTPAFHATENGNISFLKWLSEYCPSALEECDSNGICLAHMASIHDQPQIIELLHVLYEERGILSYNQLIHRDKYGATSYHYCLRSQNIKTLKILLKYNKNGINILDNKKQSAALYAIRYGDINSGITSSCIKWSSFIFPCCKEGNINIFKWLLTRITPSTLIKLKNNNTARRTPIHFSCLYNHVELLPIIIDFGGCSVNDIDYKGRTGAYFAASNGNIECLLVLQSYGADFNIKSPIIMLHYGEKSKN